MDRPNRSESSTPLDRLQALRSNVAASISSHQATIGSDPEKDADAAIQTHTAFFYGTLMVPAIVKGVTQSDGMHLSAAPGILLNHTRHKVRFADYPGVIPYEESRVLAGRDLTEEECSVRGVIITGLTVEDIAKLDEFEGEEYTMRRVDVHPLKPFETLTEEPTAHVLSDLADFSHDLPPAIPAFTYIYTSPGGLEPDLWSFEEFLRDKLNLWVSKVTDEEWSEYEWKEENNVEDEDGAMMDDDDGTNTESSTIPLLSPQDLSKLIQSKELIDASQYTKPVFGHDMLKYFAFEPGYLNLNNGAYGSLALPTLLVCQQWSLIAESKPDFYMKRQYEEMVVDSRKAIAQLIHVEDVDECFIAPNASWSLNIVLWNIEWESSDAIVRFSTTYGAIAGAVQYLQDRTPGLRVSNIDLKFPSSHESMLSQFRDHLRDVVRSSPPPSAGKQRRVLVVIDGIISRPAVRLPWEEMARIAREEGALSLIDGAHTAGQIDIDLDRIKPDFFVSNIHKWCYSKRGSTVLYIPKRHQHTLVKTPFPVSHLYKPAGQPGYDHNFDDHFSWIGAFDYTNYLSVLWSLNFRKWVGGEERIRQYIHELAVKGGDRMAEILGTAVLDNTPNRELTAAMVDVLLPLPVLESLSSAGVANITREFEDRLFAANSFATIYMYDRKWWVRASAQIWNEVEDFERMAHHLLDSCKALKAEKPEYRASAGELKASTAVAGASLTPANDNNVNESTHSAFFYGTLMVPAIVKGVTQSDGKHLTVAPAILMNHTRHKLKHANYPAIIPEAKALELTVRELTDDERSVRGVVVKGLTAEDMEKVSEWEDEGYTLSIVQVHPLKSFEPLSDEPTTHALSDLADLSQPLPNSIPAFTYIWTAPDGLEPHLWSYEEFLNDNLQSWVGKDASGKAIFYHDGNNPDANSKVE